MNKPELINIMAERSGLSVAKSRQALDALLEVIGEALRDGEKVQLIGFGTFKVTERSAREGRNPQTGESMTIAASRSPSFTAGQELKNIVNGTEP